MKEDDYETMLNRLGQEFNGDFASAVARLA